VRAVTFSRFGAPDVLAVSEVDEPAPGLGQVRIAVGYAGVNFAEVMARRGDWELSLPFTPGLEVAGVVTAVGADVEPALLGTTVAALTESGGYADMALAPANILLPIPSVRQVPLSVAAGTPCVLPTAWGVLLEAGRMRPGDDVLVHAAAGAVGGIIGQLARHFDAGRVIGVVSTVNKAVFARELGCYDDVVLAADFPVVAHTLANGRGFDVICDSVGGQTRADSAELLAPLGRLVVFGNASAAEDLRYGLLEFQQTNRTAAGYNVAALAKAAPQVYREHARNALRLLYDGAIRLAVTSVLPLRDAARAHALLESRATTGKTVLKVQGDTPASG
jgi:NADPH2:quinone reductase